MTDNKVTDTADDRKSMFATDAGFREQLAGFSLTTAEIIYRLPDYPALLQSYIWQDYDLAPRFPKLKSFLDFWHMQLDGKLFKVTVAHAKLIRPAELRMIGAEFKIPLQWEAKNAEVRATSAEAAAAQARSTALKQRLTGEVAGMVAEYRGTVKTLAIMRHHHLPDAQQALKSALAALQSPTGSLADIFAAAQRLRKIQLDILKLDTEQQIAVAELEKAIGGDL